MAPVSLSLKVPKNKSVLKPLYDDTTVKDDKTLKAEIIRKDLHWILKVQGELEKCPGEVVLFLTFSQATIAPGQNKRQASTAKKQKFQLVFNLFPSLHPGFFTVTVTDPAYPDQPLFEYDIGANCPKSFQLDFTIATRGQDNYDKHFRVQIHDSFRTIHMNVFRPAPNLTDETLGRLQYKGTILLPPLHKSTLFCFVVSFLRHGMNFEEFLRLFEAERFLYKWNIDFWHSTNFILK